MNRECPILGIVVPCYNEAEVLSTTADALLSVILDLVSQGKIHEESFLMLVDDGSRDATWNEIEKLNTKNVHVRGLRLSANRGHQVALIAGLEEACSHADIAISIDADLQDDIAVIERMVDEYAKGSEIVYGVRSKRETDTYFKKYSALFFYKLMRMLGVHIVSNHADFRLTSKRVVSHLSDYTEENLFLRGIFPLMGFKNSCVYYDRKERMAGTSKYPLFKMISFAVDGITSFSIQPLRLVMFVGLCMFLFSIIISVYLLYARYFLSVIPGWSSLVVSMYFLGGIQLLGLGVIGEYLGKVYREVKRRPRYYIETRL